MNKKILAIISKNPRLLEQCTVIQKNMESLRTQILFIEKQVENFNKQTIERNKEHWIVISNILKEEGALREDYNPENEDNNAEMLMFNLKEDFISLEKKDNEPKNILEHIFGGHEF